LAGEPEYVDLTNFDPTYEPIDSNFPAPTPGAYTVQAGDTLESIAQGAYGDSSLWYLIADANGLSGDKDLRVGQTVNIPNRVTDVHNSAGTFRPYDASTVIGGTQPNLPAPPPQPSDGGGGCGGIADIILLVVVVVVSAITFNYELAGADAASLSASAGIDAGIDGGLDAGTSIALGAAAGAAADAATQLIGDALGVYQGFDLLETLEAAGTGALFSGLVPAANAGLFETVATEAAKGALENATTQGLRLALGQQTKFNWSQVALLKLNSSRPSISASPQALDDDANAVRR
jgi:hypothetical protein